MHVVDLGTFTGQAVTRIRRAGQDERGVQVTDTVTIEGVPVRSLSDEGVNSVIDSPDAVVTRRVATAASFRESGRDMRIAQSHTGSSAKAAWDAFRKGKGDAVPTAEGELTPEERGETANGRMVNALAN